MGLKPQPGLEKRARWESQDCSQYWCVASCCVWLGGAVGSLRPWSSLIFVHLILVHLNALDLVPSSPCSVSPLPLPSLAVFSLSCTLEGPKAEWRSR